MTQRIPLVDLRAQHEEMRTELTAAISEVISESAFIGNSANRFVRTFEEQFASFTGRRHCVACGNGTDSLEILLRAAGVSRGDEVLVPAISWIATSEAVSSCGATPIFVDILRDEYTMDPAAAAAKVTSRTAAMIPVHLYGTPARMDELCSVAARHALFVLEDCAQAHGAIYRGQQVGSFGKAASYSFFPGKNLGALGDAGAMVTDDPALASSARMIAQHGQSETKHDHQIEGRNSRMDGIQAAVLSAKLRRLDSWTRSRRTLARVYQDALAGVVERVQASPVSAESVFHLFVVEVLNRETVAAKLVADGIATAVQYPRPLPLLRAYASRGHQADEFPNADQLSQRVLSLPLYPELTTSQQERVIASMRSAVSIETTA